MSYNHVTISNREPRRDREGRILDAHGGALFNRFQGRYYHYGVHYGKGDKFLPNFYFVSYCSDNFEDWTFHGRLLGGDVPAGFYYRPHVLYNDKINKYVLWFLDFSRYGPKFKGPFDPRFDREGAQKGVALSDSPSGPFEIQDIGVPLAQGKAGDHDLFLDEDGTAYIIYTSHDKDFKIFIDKLSPDFLTSTLESCAVDPDDLDLSFSTAHPGCEAPALFKRKGTYYALFGSRTDRGKEGGGLRLYTAARPLGPYRYINNINRLSDGSVIIPSQQNTAVAIETSRGTEYIWAGDRWETSEALGESYQHWQLLEFNEDGTIASLKPVEKWDMEVPVNKGT